ncbi:hypothetical protein [Streptosporangium roseum]|uniref:hypothetical protein n=1 Tax=Streptosporangium roseum TaxID=2001 RepID=UPI003333CA07
MAERPTREEVPPPAGPITCAEVSTGRDPTTSPPPVRGGDADAPRRPGPPDPCPLDLDPPDLGSA